MMRNWPRRRGVGGRDVRTGALKERTRHRLRGWALERFEDRVLLTASTYTVNLLTDTGAGSGTTGDLRYAITQADSNPGSIIQFGVTGTISLASALPDVSGDITIEGPGAAKLTIQGRTSPVKIRVFQEDAGSSLKISGLTLANGSGPVGGAINTLGNSTLDVANCTFTGDQASSSGGAIDSRGPLTISGCTFSYNTGGGGAALENDGTATIVDTTFANNAASFGGGGIDNLDTLTVMGCTFTGNSTYSYGRGGGIENYFARLTVINSTFDGNSAGAGGGLENYYTTSTNTVFTTATLTNVTFTGNSNSGVDVVGGNVTLINTIVAGDVGGQDVTGVVVGTSQDNLIGDGSGAYGISNGYQGNLVGTSAHPINALLGPLASNGGPTQTHALLAGSPAIGAGTSTVNLTTDQRGAPRPGTAVDLGAYQHDATPDTTPPTVSLQAVEVIQSNAASLNPYPFTLTFADNVDIQAATLPGAVVQVVPPGGGTPITATLVSTTTQGSTDAQGDAPIVVANYQISPPGGAWTPANNGTYSITLNGGPVTDLAGNAVAPGTIGTFTVLDATLSVASFAATSTGVTVGFNLPFSLAPLNLYDTATAGFGPADLTLVGASTGPVQGSLVVNPGNQSLSFLKTGGVLVPDTYTLTLRSAANGFTDAYGGLLDGNADGTTGDNYVTTFTVAPSSAVVVAVPDFARGPGQAVVIPAASGSGLPLTIGDGTNVTSIGLSLAYNPSLLTISGANLGPSAPAGSSVTIDTSTPGLALLSFTSPTALPAGLDTFATLVASVPNAAPYASKEALVISNLVVDGGAIAAVDQDGVHAVAYLGDTTGNGGYSSFDATLVRQVVANISTGFAAYPLLDPRIVGDIAGFGTLSGIDATYITQYVANLPQPRIPALPNVTIVAGGPDPLIWLPQDLTATPGSSLAVPVQFRQTNGSAIGLASASLAIEFDPGVFEVTGIRLGDVTSGFVLIASYDNATGEVIATERSASGAIALAPGAQGTLMWVDLAVRPGASLGSTRLNLLGEGRVGSSVVYTALNDGGLTLVPAPTDSDLDPTDGLVSVIGAGAPTTPPPSPTPIASGAPPIAGLSASATAPAASTLVVRSILEPTILGAMVDRAIEASQGDGEQGSSIESFLSALIPWTADDPSPDPATPGELSSGPTTKKARDARVLITPATPAGVSFGR